MIRELLTQAWCFLTGGHEAESNGIDSGTWCESSSWCKHCGKLM